MPFVVEERKADETGLFGRLHNEEPHSSSLSTFVRAINALKRERE